MITRRAWLLGDDRAGVGIAMITARAVPTYLLITSALPAQRHLQGLLPRPWLRGKHRLSRRRRNLKGNGGRHSVARP